MSLSTRCLTRVRAIRDDSWLKNRWCSRYQIGLSPTILLSYLRLNGKKPDQEPEGSRVQIPLGSVIISPWNAKCRLCFKTTHLTLQERSGQFFVTLVNFAFHWLKIISNFNNVIQKNWFEHSLVESFHLNGSFVLATNLLAHASVCV